MSERKNLLLPDHERWHSDDPIIELENVSKAFEGKSVIDELSLKIYAGKTTVISGESGTGKSVLLKMMNGLVLPDSGTARLFGKDLSTISETQRNELRKRCTMVFQNYALIDSMTVAENIGFSLRENTRMTAQAIRELVTELLEMLELEHAIDQLPASLSGGMKKRVALARAVVSNPEIVLFDEPTTGLDPIMIEFVDSLIEKTQREFGLTSVIVSHDMASNRRLADTIAVLASGKIVAEGSFSMIEAHPHPAVRSLMADAPTSRSLGTAISDDEGHASAEEDTENEVVIRATDIQKWFGNNHVLKGISCEIQKGKITVVIGGSGSGKSVLIKHMIGLMEPTDGQITVFGDNLASMNSKEKQRLQQRIGVLFQSAALFDSLTIRENIAFPLVEGDRMTPKAAEPKVMEVAKALSVEDLLDRLPDAISNGQRKRVALARALISQPDVVIYDEPTTGQDPVMMKNVDNMILEANRAFDVTSVVISHDMHSTFRIADQIIMIKDGELVISGPPQALKSSSDPRVQAFINAGSLTEPDT